MLNLTQVVKNKETGTVVVYLGMDTNQDIWVIQEDLTPIVVGSIEYFANTYEKVTIEINEEKIQPLIANVGVVGIVTPQRFRKDYGIRMKALMKIFKEKMK